MRSGLAAALLAPALTLLAVPAAHADDAPSQPSEPPAGAPVTKDDAVTMRGGQFELVRVLANDTDPDGAHDDLEVCRVDVPAGMPLSVDAVDSDREWGAPGDLAVSADGFRAGTYAITYYACDRQYLAPGTLTVRVERTRPVVAHKIARRPGVVRFTNPDDRPVQIGFAAFVEDRDGSILVAGRRAARTADGEPEQGTLRLLPHSSKQVRVEGDVLFWTAQARGGRAGDGLLRVRRPSR